MAHGEITRLLLLWGGGEKTAADELFRLVYRELRTLAHRQLGRRRPGETLNTTALVHEAYVKLVDHHRIALKDRGHFFCLAARAMRQILVDYARRWSAEKRGGGRCQQTGFEGLEIPVAERAAEVVALDGALARLEELEPRLGRMVELRFFGGLAVDETAEILEISERTLRRDWEKARAFLYRELRGDE